MTSRWGAILVPINEKNHEFWYKFKRTCQDRGIPYTRALLQAAELWLEQGGRPLPEVHADPVPAQVNPDAGLFPAAPRNSDPFYSPPEPAPAPLPYREHYQAPKENPFK